MSNNSSLYQLDIWLRKNTGTFQTPVGTWLNGIPRRVSGYRKSRETFDKKCDEWSRISDKCLSENITNYPDHRKENEYWYPYVNLWPAGCLSNAIASLLFGAHETIWHFQNSNTDPRSWYLRALGIEWLTKHRRSQPALIRAPRSQYPLPPNVEPFDGYHEDAKNPPTHILGPPKEPYNSRELVGQLLTKDQKRFGTAWSACVTEATDAMLNPNTAVHSAKPQSRGNEGPRPELAGQQPEKKRLRPSRLKAKAAYEWAMSMIPGAPDMTISDLHEAIMNHPSDAVTTIPDSPKTFQRYLNEAGVKRNGSSSDRRVTSSIRAESQVESARQPNSHWD